jgi:hypothetical protein
MRAWVLAALVAALAIAGCQPSPCQQLTAAWKKCWCDGATPSTTRSQDAIDSTCASDDTFLTSPDTPVPEAERAAINRCDDDDAAWATTRMDNSECRPGGSYVCGSSRGSDVCTPPA